MARGEEPLPRAIGMHEFELEGVTEKRAIVLFDLWMLQRPLDYLNSLQGEDRSAARELLTEAGGEALLDFPPFPRLVRRNYRLALARD